MEGRLVLLVAGLEMGEDCDCAEKPGGGAGTKRCLQRS